MWPVGITDKIVTPLIISATVEASEFEVDFQGVACQVALQKNSILPCCRLLRASAMRTFCNISYVLVQR